MWFKKDKHSDGHSEPINPDFAPNSAELYHFARKFRKRRARQRWLTGLFLLLPIATVGTVYWFRHLLFREGDWQQPSVILLVIFALLVVAELAILAISLANWRCSHCENLAPLRPHPARCKHCSAPLRSSEISD